MRARLSVLCLVAVLLSGAGTAGAIASVNVKKVHHRKLSATIVVDTTKNLRGSPPAPGSKVTNSGTVKAWYWGSGAFKDVAKFVGSTAPGAFWLQATGRMVFKHATLYFKCMLLATLQQDGRVFTWGDGSVTRGTGLYRHARGPLTIAGSSSGINSPATLIVTGRVSY